jgi:magnesium transporter
MSLKKLNMVTCQRLDAAVFKAVRTEAELKEFLTKATQVWIDFSEPTTEEIAWLKSVFKFHQLSIDDCTDDLHYPKLEKFPHYLFVILHALDVPQGHDFRTTEVNFFISTKTLVTFHKRALVTITTVAQNLASKAFALPLKPDALFQLLAGRLADEYFPLLDTLDEEIDAIEDSVFRAPERAQPICNRYNFVS